MRCRGLAGQTQIRGQPLEFERSNVTVWALRTWHSPLIPRKESRIVTGIDGRTARWQRHRRRPDRALRVQRQGRQFRIGTDDHARASVVIQDQVAAAVRIHRARIVAAGRIRSAQQQAVIGAVPRENRVRQYERCSHRIILDQRESHHHDTTAGLVVCTRDKVAADGRVFDLEQPVQREDRRARIRAVARSVRAVIADAALAPVHVVTGERAVARKNRTAFIEDGAAQSSAATATATAVGTSSETARVSGFAVQIDVGAYSEGCAAAKSPISSVSAAYERPDCPCSTAAAAKPAVASICAVKVEYVEAGAAAAAAVGAISAIR